ncbi:response regulator [Cohnella terricola]|uniref:Response regulator transcription factor n=1 Tax=Cohnella terricola TaxID=1289167 RepID=A0A559JMN4_9BACL|nr:response regulator transcription factor [Cohnella terricola]TVY01145.1 response regulator transcription factor [Cohnella terricola]
MKTIKLVIADDQMLTREGLRTILDLEDDMEVVGLAKNGEEAVALTFELRPTLVLLDIQMPVMDGIAALKRIKADCPETRILILTTFIDTDYIVNALAYGADGYMLKDAEGDKMIDSIRDTANGQFVLPTAVAAKLAARLAQLTEDSEQRRQGGAEWVKLTEREDELARLIIRGMNNREIAEALHITEGTVRNYISNLYGKLGVVDRAQAIVRLQALF